MRIRASWRDPYSGVPLIFTSSSPGCSRRDSAALPPSSTWATERAVRSKLLPRAHRRSVLGKKSLWKWGAHCSGICGTGLPTLPWSHEFLSKERASGRGEKKNVPSQADSPAGAGNTRALCLVWMPAPCCCSQPHVGPAQTPTVILMPKGCHHTICTRGTSGEVASCAWPWHVLTPSCHPQPK